MPPAASSAGHEALELAASAGLVADDWQADAVSDLLGEDDGGYWAATTGGLIVPRQNGKGSIIEILELAWLFLTGVELIFHSAHLFSTASDAYRRLKFLIQNTPDLHRQVLRYTEAHGQEGIELRTGQRIRFVTRSKSGGRGFPAPVVVLDEAFNLSPQAMAALVPTMAAQDNPFLLLTSSAPIDDECSDVLRTFMRRSRTGTIDRRCYIEYAAQRGDDEEQQLRDANPGYGVRLNEDVIAEERELLTTAAFEVERLGIVDLEERGDRIISAEDWARHCRPGTERGAGVAYAIDASPDLASAAICASDGRTVLVVEHHAGVGWLPATLEALLAEAPSDVWLDPKGPAGALLTELTDLGIEWQEISPQQHAQACGGLLAAALSEDGLSHSGQPVLDAAVAGATRRPYGDAWAWNRRTATVDITTLVAATIARWAALQDVDHPAPFFVRT